MHGLHITYIIYYKLSYKAIGIDGAIKILCCAEFTNQHHCQSLCFKIYIKIEQLIKKF